MTTPEACSKTVHTGGEFRGHRCSKPGRVQDEHGRWWCAIHDPAKQAARQEARNAKYQAERDEAARVVRSVNVASDRLARVLGMAVSFTAMRQPFAPPSEPPTLACIGLGEFIDIIDAICDRASLPATARSGEG